MIVFQDEKNFINRTRVNIFIKRKLYAEEKLTIEKQLVGIVGAISGTVKTETRELKAGDKIYLNETILLEQDLVLKFYY